MAAGVCVIYALCDPDTEEIRYVGKTNNIDARVRCHRWEARGSRFRTHKVRWLKQLEREPLIKVLEEVSATTWIEAERRWIKELRINGANLTNIADGGQTSPVEGRGHTEEAKAKMREAALRNGNKPPSRKGQPVSDANRQHCREAALRRGATPPKMGGWNKGVKRTSCKNGHEYSSSNTRICVRNDRGYSYQICKTCEADAQRRYCVKRRA